MGLLSRCLDRMVTLGVCAQVKDLNSGTFGFVQLCQDKTTNELVAIKFIERGEKVRSGALQCVTGGVRGNGC